jgi:hypothetical protein
MTISKIGKLAMLGAAAGLTLLSAAGFAAGARRADSVDTADASSASLERVDSIVMLRGPHSWQAIDDDTVILWATAFDPYLVELAFKSHDLRFAHVIGVTQSGSRVYAKFDAVKVGGFRYPIDSIYKMTREEARSLTRGT